MKTMTRTIRKLPWVLVVMPAFAVIFSAPVYAQRQLDLSKIQVTTTNLGHNTYMMEGGGGNVTIAVGTNGVIMVDSLYAPMHDKLKAAIATITNQPVKYLIDTHYHGDHSGGNAAFAKENVIIVAHENTKRRLASPRLLANGQTQPPGPPEALPAEVYKDKATVTIGGRVAQIGYLPNAHSDDDSYIYFPEANVLATGDLNGSRANIAVAVTLDGGTFNGIISGYDVLLKIANDQTKLVPGHGPVFTKADLQATRDMMAAIRDRVAKLKASGMTEDQAVAAKPIADFQAQRQLSDMFAERIVRPAYEAEITK